MKLFDFLLPNGVCQEKELYVRAPERAFAGDKLCLRAGDAVSFDTYFNGFFYSQYKSLTNFDKLHISLKLKGKLKIKIMLCRAQNAFDELCCLADGAEPTPAQMKVRNPREAQLEDVCLASYEEDFSSESEFVATADTQNLSDDGFLYVALEALSDAEFYGGSCGCGAPVRDVRIGVVICTFKREQYVTANIKRITEWKQLNPQYKDKLEVFVIDNGKTLSPQQVQGATLVQNRNLGGSGGFTRGIMEVLKAGGFTHFLLMDDDISFETEILSRTINVLGIAKQPDQLCVGASMLQIKRPYFQHELLAYFEGDRWRPNRYGYDMRKKCALIKNCQPRRFNYTGWWYCCMPVEKAVQNGLPLPFFIKADDVEYGMRNISQCFITNGIGVWHEDFEDKYSAELEYYTKRNEAIVDAIWHIGGGFKQYKKLVKATGWQLVKQRYFAMDNIFRAMSDFFKGADHLMSLDGEKLHMELRSHNPETFDAKELAEMGFTDLEIYAPAKKYNKFFAALTLNGYLIPSCFYKGGAKGYRVVNMGKCKPQQFYKVKNVVHYNAEAQRGFVTKQKLRYCFKAGFILIGYAFKFLFCYRHAAKSYRKKFRELTSQENWNKLLFE